MSKVVFVGNVPYNMGEEQLIEVFRSVGHVVGFRLVYDRDTGKPKGYGFCEFADHETAASAVRNLHNVDVGGRPIRIDLADSDPFLEGKTTVRGEIMDGGESRAQWRERHQDPHAFLAGLPPGTPVPPGMTSMDFISAQLSRMPVGQLMEVLAQMKAFVYTHPEQARALLLHHPQLGYALFQALLMNNIIDRTILQRMIPPASAPPPQIQQAQYAHVPTPQPHVPMNTQASLPPPMMQQPPNMYAQAMPPHIPPQSYPPQSSMYPPPQMPQQPASQPPSQAQQFHNSQAQAPVYAQPASAPATAAISDNQQRDLIMQVLSMTADQVNALPAGQRDAINQIRTQFSHLPA